MTSIDYIFDNFRITNDEESELDKQFGNLCYHAAWDLKRKNFKNNLTDDIEDIAQNIRWSIMRAGVYTKRQRYIQSSLAIVKDYVKNPFILEILECLQELWEKRTRHGANKQKFGLYQENILESLIETYVPEKDKPNKKLKLNIDETFSIYCRAIVWNESRNLGRKITRDRHIRGGLVSLSEHSYMQGMNDG